METSERFFGREPSQKIRCGFICLLIDLACDVQLPIARNAPDNYFWLSVSFGVERTSDLRYSEFCCHV